MKGGSQWLYILYMINSSQIIEPPEAKSEIKQMCFIFCQLMNAHAHIYVIIVVNYSVSCPGNAPLLSEHAQESFIISI